MTIANLSPAGNARMRVLLTKAAETTGRLIQLVQSPDTRARLEVKLAKTYARIKQLEDK